MASVSMVNFIIFCVVVLFVICCLYAFIGYIWNNIWGIVFLVVFVAVCWFIYFGLGFNPKFT